MSTLNSLKLVIAGDGGCGKTLLLYAYTNKAFKEEHVPTVLDAYTAEITVQNRELSLEINDTAGQEDFEELRRLIYPGTHLYILCYSCVNRVSLKNVRDFWYKEISMTTPNSQMILVGNKSDMKSEKPEQSINPNEAAEVMKAIKAKASLQCSAKEEAYSPEGGNVQAVFKTAIKYAFYNAFPRPPATGKSWCPCTVIC